MQKYKIYNINGPLVTIKGKTDLRMSEMVYAGENNLIGEVISLYSTHTIVQVFEDTQGLAPGDYVTGTDSSICVSLGPGIISNIYDGIERPLRSIADKTGAFIGRGASVSALDEEKLWDTTITVKKGDYLKGGDIIANVPETPSIMHKVMVPPDLSGEVIDTVPNGRYNIKEPLITIRNSEGEEFSVCMMQKWPIRIPRPVQKRFPISEPLITGQRILDSIFPIAKGGTAAIPGGFGTGKTMTQHQIAKWSDADIII